MPGDTVDKDFLSCKLLRMLIQNAQNIQHRSSFHIRKAFHLIRIFQDGKGRYHSLSVRPHQCFIRIDGTVLRGNDRLEMIGKEILVQQLLHRIPVSDLLFCQLDCLLKLL